MSKENNIKTNPILKVTNNVNGKYKNQNPSNHNGQPNARLTYAEIFKLQKKICELEDTIKTLQDNIKSNEADTPSAIELELEEWMSKREVLLRVKQKILQHYQGPTIKFKLAKLPVNKSKNVKVIQEYRNNNGNNNNNGNRNKEFRNSIPKANVETKPTEQPKEAKRELGHKFDRYV